MRVVLTEAFVTSVTRTESSRSLLCVCKSSYRNGRKDESEEQLCMYTCAQNPYLIFAYMLDHRMLFT